MYSSFVGDDASEGEQRSMEEAAMAYEAFDVPLVPEIAAGADVSRKGKGLEDDEWVEVNDITGVVPGAMLKRAVVEGLRRNWTLELESVLGMPSGTVEERLCKGLKLHALVVAFEEAAELVCEVLVRGEEQCFLSVRGKGVAGGEKYFLGNLMVKYARDWAGVYGGDGWAGKAASHELKSQRAVISAGVEGLFVPLSAMVDLCGHRLVVSARVDIREGTLVYGSDDQGQRVWNCDTMMNDKMRKLAWRLNLALHSGGPMGGRRCIWGPLDIEGHRVKEDKRYLIDVARLCPPTLPSSLPTAFFIPERGEDKVEAIPLTRGWQRDVLSRLPGARLKLPLPEGILVCLELGDERVEEEVEDDADRVCGDFDLPDGWTKSLGRLEGNERAGRLAGRVVRGDAVLLRGTGSFLVQLLRVEAVSSGEDALSSDASTQMGACEQCRPDSDEVCDHGYREHLQRVERASSRVLDQARALAEDIDGGVVALGSAEQLVEEMHSRGINLRYLEVIRSKVTAKWPRVLIITEIVGRCLRTIIRSQLRRSDNPEQSLGVMLCQIFGSGESVDGMWSRVSDAALHKFHLNSDTLSESQPMWGMDGGVCDGRDLRCALGLRKLPLLLRLSDLVGFRYDPESMRSIAHNPALLDKIDEAVESLHCTLVARTKSVLEDHDVVRLIEAVAAEKDGQEILERVVGGVEVGEEDVVERMRVIGREEEEDDDLRRLASAAWGVARVFDKAKRRQVVAPVFTRLSQALLRHGRKEESRDIARNACEAARDEWTLESVSASVALAEALEATGSASAAVGLLRGAKRSALAIAPLHPIVGKTATCLGRTLLQSEDVDDRELGVEALADALRVYDAIYGEIAASLLAPAVVAGKAEDVATGLAMVLRRMRSITTSMDPASDETLNAFQERGLDRRNALARKDDSLKTSPLTRSTSAVEKALDASLRQESKDVYQRTLKSLGLVEDFLGLRRGHFDSAAIPPPPLLAHSDNSDLDGEPRRSWRSQSEDGQWKVFVEESAVAGQPLWIDVHVPCHPDEVFVWMQYEDGARTYIATVCCGRTCTRAVCIPPRVGNVRIGLGHDVGTPMVETSSILSAGPIDLSRTFIDVPDKGTADEPLAVRAQLFDTFGNIRVAPYDKLVFHVRRGTNVHTSLLPPFQPVDEEAKPIPTGPAGAYFPGVPVDLRRGEILLRIPGTYQVSTLVNGNEVYGLQRSLEISPPLGQSAFCDKPIVVGDPSGSRAIVLCPNCARLKTNKCLRCDRPAPSQFPGTSTALGCRACAFQYSGTRCGQCASMIPFGGIPANLCNSCTQRYRGKCCFAKGLKQ